MQGWTHTEVCWKAGLTYNSDARNIYAFIYIWMSFQIPLLRVPYSCKSRASPHPWGFRSSAPWLCHSSLQQSPMRIGRETKGQMHSCTDAHCNKGEQLSLDITNMCELAWLFVIPFLLACSHSFAEFKHTAFSSHKCPLFHIIRPIESACWGIKKNGDSGRRKDEGERGVRVKEEKFESKSLSSFLSSTRNFPECRWTCHCTNMYLDWEIRQTGTPDNPQHVALLGVLVVCLWVTEIPLRLAP